MTSWVERVDTYQDLQKESSERHRQKEVLNKSAQRRFEEARDVAKELFEQFGVLDALRCLRDDVWEEGLIEEAGRYGYYIIGLYTSIPRIDVVGSLKDGKIRIREGKVSFTITHSLFNNNVDLRSNDHLICLTDSPMPSRKPLLNFPPFPIIKCLIQQYGADNTWANLRTMFDYYRDSSFYGTMTCRTCGIGNLLSGTPSFNTIFVETVQKRIDRNALPNTLRKEAENVLYQLSPYIESDDTILGSNLLRWQYQILQEARSRRPWYRRLLSRN